MGRSVKGWKWSMSWPPFIRRKVERALGKKNLLFYLLGLFFGAGVKIKNILYDRGVLKVKKCNAYVISVGNIVAGGTGKTPLTQMLAEQLLPFVKVGIVSRGYRAVAEKRKVPIMVCNGSGPNFLPHICGDEPYLFSKKFTRRHCGCRKRSCQRSRDGNKSRS